MKTKNVVSAIALSACFGIAYNAQPVSAQPANNILSTGNASNEYVTLRFNVQPGSKYRMTQVAQVKEVVIAPPMRGRPAQKTEITSTSTNVLDYAVLYNNPDGTKQIRLTYGAIRNNTSVKVNSKTQAVPPSINVASRALVGQQIGLKISPEGQVSDVRGLDNIWKKAFSSVTAPGMTPKMRQQMQDSMKKMLGDNYMKSIMQQSGMMLPENPIKIGSSWTQRIETGGQLPFVVNLRRTLQGRANGLLSIAEKGALSMGDVQKTLSVGPTSMQMAITGTYSGTTILDETTGFTHSANVVQHFGGDITTKVNNQKFSTKMFGLVTINVQVEKLQ